MEYIERAGVVDLMEEGGRLGGFDEFIQRQQQQQQQTPSLSPEPSSDGRSRHKHTHTHETWCAATSRSRTSPAFPHFQTKRQF